MTAILVDIASYGVLAAIGYGALKLLSGRYYGRKNQPKPDETKPPKDNE